MNESDGVTSTIRERPRILPAGTQPPVRPVRCPGCGTYSTGFESSGYYSYDLYRCINGHRWMMTPPSEGGAGPAYRYPGNSIRIFVPERAPVAIHCPKCSHEASLDVYGCQCASCGYNTKQHRRRWPEEAFYQVDVNGNTLWAWSRGYAVALRDFIASQRREPRDYPGHEYFLYHIPKDFLHAKHREVVVRRLDRLLKT